MNIYEKLFKVQQSLVAPKDQFNNFGKYTYRSCEGILEALKPHLSENKLLVILSDEVKEIGSRVYVEATATAIDAETGEKVKVTASAREEESKKGMDSSQVTGASSSYARKYALNGLFAIDDNKDSDATNNGDKSVAAAKEYKNTAPQKESAQKPAEAAREPKQAPDGYYYCEKCGDIIKEIKQKDGTVITQSEAAKRTLSKYGKQLCLNCAKNEKPTA